MANIANYCPDDVTVLVAGIVPIEGFVDGTFISIKKDVVPFTSVRMPDGTVCRIQNSDQTYTIDVTVHNGSRSNDVLTKLWQLDEITNGKGKFPLLIKDHSGTDLLFSTSTWIESPPDMDKSVSMDSRVWTLRSAFAAINIGTNNEPSDLTDDLINLVTSALPALNGIL